MSEHDDWIEHDGGECPLAPGTRYERRYRCGDVQTATIRSDDEWNADVWAHGGETPEYDIVAYRVVKP